MDQCKTRSYGESYLAGSCKRFLLDTYTHWVVAMAQVELGSGRVQAPAAWVVRRRTGGWRRMTARTHERRARPSAARCRRHRRSRSATARERLSPLCPQPGPPPRPAACQGPTLVHISGSSQAFQWLTLVQLSAQSVHLTALHAGFFQGFSVGDGSGRALKLFKPPRRAHATSSAAQGGHREQALDRCRSQCLSLVPSRCLAFTPYLQSEG